LVVTSVGPRTGHQDRYHLLLTNSELSPENAGASLIFKWPLMDAKDNWIRSDLSLKSASIPSGDVYSGKVKSIIAGLVSRAGRGELRIAVDFGDMKASEWARKELSGGHSIPVEIVFDHNPPDPREPGASDRSSDVPPAPPAVHYDEVPRMQNPVPN
jgi:hypothetical protein